MITDPDGATLVACGGNCTCFGRTSDVPGDALTDPGIEQIAETIAPAFAGFGAWAHRMADEHQLDRLVFLSREGPFLRRVYEAVAGEASRAASSIAVSRRSTFAASLELPLSSSVRPMWDRYRSQTPRELIRALDLPVEDVTELVDRHGLRLDDSVIDPWDDERISGLLDAPSFVRLFLARQRERQPLLSSYLASQGLLRSGRYGVVDVGWRGSIQDSLHLLDPSSAYVGLYLAYRPPGPLGLELRSAEKFGFVAGERSSGPFGQELRAAASALEMLSMTAGGTTTGYARAADGNVIAVREPIEAEEQVIASHIAPLQNLIVQSCGALASDTDQPSGAASLAVFKRVLFDPPPMLVDAYSAFALDPSIAGGSPSGGGRSASLLRPDRRMRSAVQDHGWPHALVKERIGGRAYATFSSVGRRVPGASRWWG